MNRRISPVTLTWLSIPRLFLPVGAVLLLLCAGCHKEDTPQPAPSAVGNQAPAGQETPENQKILDDFNRKHPGMGAPVKK